MSDLKNMTRDELKAHLDKLLAEREACERSFAAAKGAEKRIRELQGEWNFPGEIKCAKLALRDREFPIFAERWKITRVVDLCDKWISLRDDGSEIVTQYRRDTGQKKGTRAEHTRIDAAKAVAIWSAHKGAK